MKWLGDYSRKHPYPLMFVTVSGAHLYGFESPDSDYDLRGCHITPVRQLVQMSPPSETHEVMDRTLPIEMDLVTHDIKKFFTLLLKHNGYVLEQAASPLVVVDSPEFAELRELIPGVITRHHRHHFLRFGQNQWQEVVKSGRPTVKGLLYTYRVLLAGIHLMRTGKVESNLRRLNEIFKLNHINDLIAAKIAGEEKQELKESLDWHENEFNRLCAMLEDAHDHSQLPEEPTNRAAFNDLLIRSRMRHLN
ncbi:MAG TPA: nucleotidyltransferase domain-containing protein [Phycisphaerales bacterium]|nr:nucleotidyltransferase domain-containing protein [Phycisphaerales bacterium]